MFTGIKSPVDLAVTEEIAMTALKQTNARFVRWFKTFRDKNRPPHRYYEHGLYDA